jgi:hypothetical protein
MRHLKHPATIVSMVALFAALSGGAIAGTLISGSQIKNHSISAKKLTALAVRQLRGHRGPAGPMGAPGADGAPGVFSTSNVTQVSGPVSVQCPAGGGACDVGSSVATCPSGSVVLGGGFDSEGAPPVEATVAFDKPLGTDSWEVILVNNGTISQNFFAVATCATPGSGTAAAASALTSAQRTQVATDTATARAGAR